MPKPESNDLEALLAAQSPAVQASILAELLRKEHDPNDPLFRLLRILRIALDVSEETMKVSDQLPLRMYDLLSETDKRFAYYVQQWRGLPPEMLATFRGALLAIIPEIQDKAKAMAVASAAEQLDNLAKAHGSTRKDFEDELRSVALTVMHSVSQQTAQTLRVGEKSRKIAMRFMTLAYAVGMCLLGAFGGYGWAEAHLTYPPSIQKNIEAGEQYRAMYPHMPADMQAWIKRWMAAR